MGDPEPEDGRRARLFWEGRKLGSNARPLGKVGQAQLGEGDRGPTPVTIEPLALLGPRWRQAARVGFINTCLPAQVSIPSEDIAHCVVVAHDVFCECTPESKCSRSPHSLTHTEPTNEESGRRDSARGRG